MLKPFNGEFSTTNLFNDPRTRAYYKATFGWNGHNGIDYSTPANTPIIAAHSGTIYSAFDSGAGNYIYISRPNLETVYMHLSRRDVVTGQTVSEGQQIGLSGNTGNSTGPHLHFGVRPIPYNRNNGFEGYVDPEPYLKEEDMPEIVDKDWLVRLYYAYFFRAPDPGADVFLGKPLLEVVNELASSPERKQVDDRYNSAGGEFTPVAEALYRKKK